jgi:hypothetical protein
MKNKSVKIVNINNYCFGLDKESGEITYDIDRWDRRREVAFMTDNNYYRTLESMSGTMYVYNNPKTTDGLWPVFPKESEFSWFGPEFRDEVYSMYGMLHRVCFVEENN